MIICLDSKIVRNVQKFHIDNIKANKIHYGNTLITILIIIDRLFLNSILLIARFRRYGFHYSTK